MVGVTTRQFDVVPLPQHSEEVAAFRDVFLEEGDDNLLPVHIGATYDSHSGHYANLLSSIAFTNCS